MSNRNININMNNRRLKINMNKEITKGLLISLMVLLCNLSNNGNGLNLNGLSVALLYGVIYTIAKFAGLNGVPALIFSNILSHISATNMVQSHEFVFLCLSFFAMFI